MTTIVLAGLVAFQQTGSAALPTMQLLEGRTLTFAVAQEEPSLPPPPLPPSYQPPAPTVDDGGEWVPSLGLVLPLMIGGGVLALGGIPVAIYGLISAIFGCYNCNAAWVSIGGIGDIVLGSMLFFIGNHYRGVRNQALRNLAGYVSLHYEPKSRALAVAVRF